MPPDGTCPTCGTIIAEPPDETKVPWHFWVLALLVAVYLGWRLVQLFQWLVGNDHAIFAVLSGCLLLALALWLGVWLWRNDPEEDDEAELAG